MGVRGRGAWLTATGATLLLGCSGEILDPPGSASPRSPSPGSARPGSASSGSASPDPVSPDPESPPSSLHAPMKFQCTTPTARGSGEARMTRLTTGALINTMTHLLGADIIAV